MRPTPSLVSSVNDLHFSYRKRFSTFVLSIGATYWQNLFCLYIYLLFFYSIGLPIAFFVHYACTFSLLCMQVLYTFSIIALSVQRSKALKTITTWTCCLFEQPLLLGSGRKRGGSRPFDTAKDLLQRSVCWCAELTVGRPASMMRWISSLRTSGEEPPFFLWTGPLLVDDPSLERECATVATHHSLPSLPNGGAGLVNDVRSQEAILKFGSTNAAEGFVYFSGVERKL